MNGKPMRRDVRRMTELDKLAEACERAAEYAQYVSDERIVYLYQSGVTSCRSLTDAESYRVRAEEDMKTLARLSWAIRAGRVTIDQARGA